MENTITIALPVKSYIKKYLETQYGADYKVNISDSFGILILNVLHKKTSYYNYKREKDNREESFPIHISLSNFEKYGCGITDMQLYLIHKSIDYDFRMSMFQAAVINHRKFGIRYKESIESFLDSFNISEDELSYSTIRKDFNRKKTKIEQSLNLKRQI